MPVSSLQGKEKNNRNEKHKNNWHARKKNEEYIVTK
jgi:hypothetical protein